MVQVVPRLCIVNPCRLILYGDLFLVVDEINDGFGNCQIVNNQVAKLILWISDLMDVLVKIRLFSINHFSISRGCGYGGSLQYSHLGEINIPFKGLSGLSPIFIRWIAGFVGWTEQGDRSLSRSGAFHRVDSILNFPEFHVADNTMHGSKCCCKKSR